MKDNYLLAIGYSIGLVPYENKIVAIVDKGNETIILDVKSFSVWQLIFEAVDMDTYLTKYNEIYDDNDGEKILDYLISSKAVLKIDFNKTFEEQYEELKNYRLFRQGVGIGIDKDDINKYTILTNRKNILDPVEFTVWSSANMTLNIEEIYNSFNERIDKQVLISILLSLYHSNLIYLMG